MAGAEESDARMSEAEALMWRLESFDARLRAVITVVVSLERAPAIDAVARRVDALTRALPRFRERVAPSPTGWATPRWERDAQFDLGRHVRGVVAPGEGTLDDVLAVAGLLAAEGLDRSRPLWQVEVVDGMAGGRGALVIRLHHTFTDGLGALKLAALLFDLQPDAPVPDLPTLVEPRPRRVVEQVAGDVAHEADRARRMVGWAVPTVGGLLRDAVTDPRRRAGSTLELARSVGRSVTPSSRPCSPVMTGRSTATELRSLTLDLEEVRGVAAAAGATVNDVFLSAVIDGLRRYHARHASAPASLRLGIPINLRPAGDERLRNQFFPARLLVPLQIRDPLDRLRAVHDLVLDARAEPALTAYDPLAGIVGRLAGAEAVIGRTLRSLDVMTSNVAGSPDALYLAGERVLALVPFGPRSGAGLNLTTLSYDGTLHVGVNLDPAATPDIPTLMECLADAFAESVIYA